MLTQTFKKNLVILFFFKFVLKQGFGMFPMAFVPRIDRERKVPFVPARPEKLITARKFNQVPLILGVVQNEGALVTSCNRSIHLTIFCWQIRANSSFESCPFLSSLLSRWEPSHAGLQRRSHPHHQLLDQHGKTARRPRNGPTGPRSILQ